MTELIPQSLSRLGRKSKGKNYKANKSLGIKTKAKKFVVPYKDEIPELIKQAHKSNSNHYSVQETIKQLKDLKKNG